MMKAWLKTICFALLLCGILAGVEAPRALAADMTLQFDPESGLFRLRYKSHVAVKGGAVFWRQGWQWVPRKIAVKSPSPLSYDVEETGLKSALASITAKANPANPRQMQWTITTRAGTDQYGGLNFHFDLTALARPGFEPQPTLISGNQGWQVQLAPDQKPVRFRIEPPPEIVAFEGDKKRDIRVYLAVPGKAVEGRSWTLTVDMPEDAQIIPTDFERLTPLGPDWYTSLLEASKIPVDLSFLNEAEKPAGKRGFVSAENGVLRFADGTPARFWGTNLTAYALFDTDPGQIRLQARRLSRLGFNLVRIHHFDSAWVQPNMIASEDANGLQLNEASLRQLDLWIKELGDEGIYVEIDLNVGRRMFIEDVPGKDELHRTKNEATAKGFAYLNPAVERKMQEFNALLLRHVNAYTGLAYGEDPRIAALLITNENDLMQHFGNSFLPDKNRPFHNAIFMDEAARFAKDRKLDSERTWRSWEYGPSKLFLAELEHHFYQRMIASLRQQGARMPIIATSSFGLMTAVSLMSLADGDIVAVNSYASESGSLLSNPEVEENFGNWVAAAALNGRPLAITEWNVGDFPSYDRAALPLYLATLASFQQWDAPIQFAYAQSPPTKWRRPSSWEMAIDPSMVSMMAVGALIFRRQDVQAGGETFYLAPQPGDFVDQPLSPRTSRAIRTLTERHRFRMAMPDVKELPWFKPAPLPAGASTVTNMAENFATGENESCADSNEFCRNWQDGVFRVDTQRTVAVAGWIGGKSFELGPMKLAAETPNGAVAVQSLDAQSIGESDRILITLAAQTLAPQGGRSETMSEPFRGKLALRAKPGLTANALTNSGFRRLQSVQYKDGEYVFLLDPGLKSYWIELRAE